ncbi:MAG: hypothetical protein FJ315_04865, partial [SAR202 cluster bacterium]|nr:hypothetical protein [SAR202 cluster bacterium]
MPLAANRLIIGRRPWAGNAGYNGLSLARKRSMPDSDLVIPLFPIRAVLFPGVAIPMNVFEQRYRTMMEEVLAGDRTFGIVLIKTGLEVGGPATPMDVGTIASVEDLQRRQDGRMSFNALGRQRFRILELIHDRPYLRGRIKLLPVDEPPADATLVDHVRVSFFVYLEAAAGLTGGWLHEWCKAADGLALSYVVAYY